MSATNSLDVDQDVRQDTVTSWRLELKGNSDLAEMATVLQKNHTVTDVDICVHDSLVDKTELEVASLFEKLSCSLQGLRKLEYYPGTGSYNPFPVEALTSALQRGTKLECLYVYQLELRGDSNKFQAFAKHLEQCQSLREVCFIDCRMCTGQGENHQEFDPILRSLGKLRCLEGVGLWADNLGGLSGESLAEVCRSSSLERLLILGFDINDQHLSRMFNEVERNQTMRRLTLSCDMGTVGSRSLSNMLRRNTKLEKLKIELEVAPNEKDLVEIAQALNVNPALNYFKLSGQGTGSSTVEKGSSTVEKAFTAMLESNFTLETLIVLDVHSPKSEMYLKLNRRGRGAAFQTAQRKLWLKALVNCNGDLDCLFYFLSVNPALLK